jgi:DNA-binding protein H-NS
LSTGRPNISSHSSSQSLKAPETLTKRQRQNAQKREQQKAAKVDAETQRLATLAGHKRDLEKVRMEELFSKGSGSKPSGGMRAAVNEQGKLIWE